MQKLAAQHFVFAGVEGKVRELPAAMWTEYVAKVWPELVGHFPDAAELPALIDAGAVFFGPFLCFQATPPAPAPSCIAFSKLDNTVVQCIHQWKSPHHPSGGLPDAQLDGVLADALAASGALQTGEPVSPATNHD
jgi:hypothetical protein